MNTMNFFLKTKHKINNNKGESIAEVLVSVLISSLGLLLLASMVNASAREILKKSKSSMADYWSSEVRLVDQDNPTFTENIGYPFKIGSSEDSDNFILADGWSETVNIDFFVNSSSTQPVVSYRLSSSETGG